MSYLAIGLMAFFASFSHCYAMCGGFVLAFSRLCDEKRLIFYQMLYHLARVFAYFLLGLAFAAFGSVFAFSKLASSLLLFVLAIFLILLGLALFFRGRLLFLIENSLSIGYLRGFIKKSFKLRGFKAALFLGFLNGLLPCGLVYSFLAIALSSQDYIKGGMIMAVFGLSTLPAMMCFSLFIAYFSKKFISVFNKISCALIISYGIYLAYQALALSR